MRGEERKRTNGTFKPMADEAKVDLQLSRLPGEMPQEDLRRGNGQHNTTWERKKEWHLEQRKEKLIPFRQDTNKLKRRHLREMD